MSRAVSTSLPLLLTVAIVWGCGDSDSPMPTADSFLGQTLPGETPVRFAEGIITDGFYPHSRMIISPSEDRIYWTTFMDLVSSDTALYYSKFSGGVLGPAEADANLAKQGIKSFVFFNDADTILFGDLRPYEGMEGDEVYAVWMAEWTGLAWSTPEPIESTIDNDWASLGSVSFNSSGDIYFTGRKEGGTAKIYCTKYVNGEYQPYEQLPEIINTGIAIDPFIDYQDKYLLFSAAERAENIGRIDLYVSFKDGDGHWGEPSNLGEGISTEYLDRFPMVTSDGRFLFFVTSHSNHFPSEHTHFYWMDAKVLREPAGQG